jgi:hypothetical protein
VIKGWDAAIESPCQPAKPGSTTSPSDRGSRLGEDRCELLYQHDKTQVKLTQYDPGSPIETNQQRSLLLPTAQGKTV